MMDSNGTSTDMGVSLSSEAERIGKGGGIVSKRGGGLWVTSTAIDDSILVDFGYCGSSTSTPTLLPSSGAASPFCHPTPVVRQDLPVNGQRFGDSVCLVTGKQGIGAIGWHGRSRHQRILARCSHAHAPTIPLATIPWPRQASTEATRNDGTATTLRTIRPERHHSQLREHNRPILNGWRTINHLKLTPSHRLPQFNCASHLIINFKKDLPTAWERSSPPSHVLVVRNRSEF
ncbi:hypothetical protein IW261DRAFT_1637953 [Armillaria novae-zelandiae]|uniref:Uncharacterized protein n=1 Tax=Armillaria novae-zelandiae TaxID=153914 RepID=A0AA39KFQ8_9AGAR|nr:hypothetical protein IW261DRAFT_1637953 [Armillaria novae-zelandiae]